MEEGLRGAGTTPVPPDPWMPLRILNYCVQVWRRWRDSQADERGLPLIVPLALYQGAQPWRYELEVTEAAPTWRWVPRFEHR